MSFGVATADDALSWAIVLLLGAKAAATVIILASGAGRAESALWWTAKLTPVAAVPLAILLAARRHQGEEVAIFALLAAFVAIMVPLHIRRRIRIKHAAS